MDSLYTLFLIYKAKHLLKGKNITDFKLPLRVCLRVCIGLLPSGSSLQFHLIKFDFFSAIFHITS